MRFVGDEWEQYDYSSPAAENQGQSASSSSDPSSILKNTVVKTTHEPEVCLPVVDGNHSMSRSRVMFTGGSGIHLALIDSVAFAHVCPENFCQWIPLEAPDPSISACQADGSTLEYHGIRVIPCKVPGGTSEHQVPRDVSGSSDHECRGVDFKRSSCVLDEEAVFEFR